MNKKSLILSAHVIRLRFLVENNMTIEVINFEKYVDTSTYTSQYALTGYMVLLNK